MSGIEQVAADAIIGCLEWYPTDVFGDDLTIEQWQAIRDVSPYSTEQIASDCFRRAYRVALQEVRKAFAEWHENQAEPPAARPVPVRTAEALAVIQQIRDLCDAAARHAGPGGVPHISAPAVLRALEDVPVPVPPTVETLAEILSGIAQDFYGPFMPADTVAGSAQRRESIDIARALLADKRITIRAVEGDTQEAGQ